MKIVIISVLADDRPGIVEKVADSLSAHQGNWLESRLAKLAGHFAGIVRAEVPDEHEAGLIQALGALNSAGIHITVTRPDATVEPAEGSSGVPATIRVTGSDRAGIVREITALLARQAVNVQELSSHCENAPMSGDRLFVATLKVILPEHLTEEDLAQVLEDISDDLMVDLEH